MSSWTDLLERNAKYAETSHQPRPFIGEPGQFLPSIFIVACMDPRAPVEQFLNISPSEAVISRNAGGRARAALRDLVFLDTFSQGAVIKDVIVIHHTDCGCTHASDDDIKGMLKGRFEGEEKDIDGFWFGTFGAGDLDTLQNTVKEDLAFLRGQAIVRQELKDAARGYIYDIKSGKLTEVVY